MLYKSKKIWLTTKNGFLGRELQPFLTNQYELLATDRKQVDLLNGKQVEDFIVSNKIDYIVHNAIRGGRRIAPDDANVFYENILMFENIIRLNGYFKKIINFDSGASFDRRRNIENAKESDLGMHVPIDYYGLSKMIIVKRGLNYNNFYNLRIFNCFGPTETPERMIKNNINSCLKKEDLVVHCNKLMDFFYIDDLKIVLNYFLNNDSLPKDINLVYSDKFYLTDIAEIIKKITGNTYGKIQLNSHKLDNSYTGCAATINKLNLPLGNLENGIKNMYELLK